MKKIGILNCSHIVNFGSVLQSYAVEKVVRDLTGRNVVSIRYKQKKGLLYLRNYLPLLLEKELVAFKWRGVKRKLYLKFINKNLGNQCRIREKHFTIFVNKHFNLSNIYIGRKHLIDSTNEYSVFILGSDQVWHPINFGSHYYTMEWIPNDVPKITYAASFGVGSIPNRQKKTTKKYLKRIQDISVREERGAELVRELTGKEVPVVVDPTLLLDKKDWDAVSNKIPDSNDFIFCYFLGNNKKARDFAAELSQKTGLKIISILFMDEINKMDFGFGDEQLFEIGPGEFISYIKNATYIVTDSFHGTIFSLIYHKKFITFDRFSDNGTESTNSRMDTLFEKLKLQNQRGGSGNDLEKVIDNTIDYDTVDKRCQELKNESIDYLKKALESNKII